MSAAQTPAPPDRPYGSDPQRPQWPLWLFGILVAACAIFLFLMALLYPGR